MTGLKTARYLILNTFREWREDKASRLAAALSYYAILSLSPLLVICLAIAGLFLDREAVRAQVLAQAQQLVGETGSRAIGQVLQNADDPNLGSIAAVVSTLMLLFAASGAFVQLQDALNTVWDVAARQKGGVLAQIRARFLSFTMVLAVGFLLLVSLVLSTILAAIGQSVSGLTGDTLALARILNFLISFAGISFLFALIFKFVPDVEVAWRDVWLGAILTALLFTVGKWAIGLYLGQSATVSAYGAAASVVILLIWVYFSAQIMFLGAEFTQVYARRFGQRVKPARNAKPLTEEERAKQGMPRGERPGGTRAG